MTGNDNPKDWVVDPKQSLISHRGREGGDYFYGQLNFSRASFGSWNAGEPKR